MAVVHQHVRSVAGRFWIGLGFPAQQRIGVDARAVILVAEGDAAEITFG